MVTMQLIEKKMHIQKTKLYVQLSSHIADYRLSYLSVNARLEEKCKPDGMAFFEISSLKEASELCQNFIDKYNLGSSNSTGGLIIDENQNFIAHVSYNGRVWDSEDWKISKEIEV